MIHKLFYIFKYQSQKKRSNNVRNIALNFSTASDGQNEGRFTIAR